MDINYWRLLQLFDHACTTAPLFLVLLLELISLHISWVLGSLVAIPIQRRFRFGQITVASCWGLVLCWSFYPLAHVPLALGAVGAGLSIMSIIFDVALHSYRLGLIPDSLRGRVSSITSLLASCSRATGIAVTGFLLEFRWVFPTIAFLWGFLFLAAVIATLSTALRRA